MANPMTAHPEQREDAEQHEWNQVWLEPICAVLSEHGIKIAPFIYYARVKTSITLAELAEAYLVKLAGGSAFRPTGRLWVRQAVARRPPHRP